MRLLGAVEGAEAQVHTILFADGPLRAALEAAGHAVEVVPLDEGLATTHRHDVGPVRSARQALAVLPFVRRLGRRLRELDVDVVHTTSLKADLIGTPAAWLARRPLVWHVHDRISPDYLPRAVVVVLRTMARWIPRQVVVNSRATARTLPGVRRLSIAYPGVAPEQVLADPASRPAPAGQTVGIIGRISPTKGQLEFVRAAAQVLDTHPEARFRVVGAALFAEQDYEAQVRAEVDRLGIADRVTFTGFVANPVTELDAFAVCVHASGTPEPFGQVIVEAMVRGVPVVATRGGGVTEIVEPPSGGPYGILVPPDDPDALARAITGVLDAPDEARARAAAAWEWGRTRFAVAETARVVTRAWRRAAAGRSRRASG